MKKIIILSIILSTLIGCEHRKYPIEIITSPSGKYQIKTTINTDESDRTKYLCVKLHLLDTQSKELSQLQSSASHTMKWVIGWMEKNDIIVLDSSDIGTYAYEIENNTLKKIGITEVIIKRGEQLKKLKYKP